MRPRHALPAHLGPGAIAAIGLLLGIAGTLAPHPGGPVSPATPLSLQLPDWLVMVAVATLTAASLLFLVFIFSRPRNRRKKDDQDILYIEPRKLNPVVAVLLIVLALSPTGILGGGIFWFDRAGERAHEAPVVSPSPHRPAFPRTAAVPPASPLAEPAHPAPPLTTGLLGSFALLIGFGSLGFVLWLWLGDRLLRRDADAPEAFRALVAGAVDDSFDDLRLEPEARAAIIKTYRHFERALAAAELPRRPWQTPTEFMRIALLRLLLPEMAVANLTQLFERARFSRHQLDTADREAAWRALSEIRAAVGRGRRPDAAVS